MEIRRIGDNVLRSYSLHSLLFLAPSTLHKLSRAASNHSHHSLGSLSICRRSFVTHQTLRETSSDTGDQIPAPSPYSRTESSSNYQPVNPARSTKTKQISGLLDTLLEQTFRSNPKPGDKANRFTRTLPNDYNKPGGKSSLTTFQEAWQDSPLSIKSRQGDIAKRMVVSESSAPRILVRPRAVRTMKSRPSLGRTVEIDPLSNVKDLPRAFRVLTIACNRNKVRYDRSSQRFHERPGLKKKRLKRERWRKRFSDGFIAMKEKVEQMRLQGW